MVARFHLQARYRRKVLSSTRKRWEQATKIDNGLKDGLIRISVTDRDPREAAAASQWMGGRVPALHRDAGHHRGIAAQALFRAGSK